MCYSKMVFELDYYIGEYVYLIMVFNCFENLFKYIIDVVLCYVVSCNLILSVGVNNLFDVKFDKLLVESVYFGFN